MITGPGLGPIVAQQVDVDELSDALDTGGLDQWDWLTAGLVIVVGIALAIGAHRLVTAGLERRGSEGFAADLIGRLVGSVVAVVGLVYGLSMLGVRIGPLLGALGILGIAFAFAVKDVLENFIAGLILQMRRPFDRGDQIVAGEYEGTVRHIDTRAVVVDDPDGRRIVIPSSVLITDVIVNLTAHPVRRTTLDVSVAYGTDLDRASEILRTAVAAVDGVVPVPAVEAFAYEFAESGITIAVRYWHTPTIAEMWRVRDEVARSVKRVLDAEGIEIPFPQRVLTIRSRPDSHDTGLLDDAARRS